MLRGENISLVFRRKLFALVEGHLERGIVRLQDDIRSDDLIFQFGMFALVPRILMATHIPPRPAVKTPILYVCNVVGNQIVSEAVAFIDGAPQFASLRIYCKPDRVTNSVGVDSHV